MNAQTPTPNPQPIEPDADLLLDGVHFDLPEDEYRADPALGSTDMKRLSYSPADFWWGSVHNPFKEPEKERPALVMGRALHAFVLEGRDKFFAEYAPTELSGSTREARAEREAIADAGKQALRRADFDRILAAGSTLRANPHLATAFSNGRSEVSVFWTANGIRRKARIDYLKPLANVDLKSISNTREVNFVECCRRSVAILRYDVQAEHYLEARVAMRAFVRDDQIFGDHDLPWLRTCVEPKPTPTSSSGGRRKVRP